MHRFPKWISACVAVIFAFSMFIGPAAIASESQQLDDLVLVGSAIKYGDKDSATRTTVVSSAGELTNAVAKTDAKAFIGINQVASSGGTWTKTRGAQGNWYHAKTAASDNSFISADITNLMRTTTSKGLKLTSFDVIYANGTATLDNVIAYLSKITYADNSAVTVSTVTTTPAGNLTISNDNVSNPLVGTVTVSTPAFQNTDNAKWTIDLWINSTAQSSAVFRFHGFYLNFTYDPI